ncbi:MAG: hypothetical protein EPN84_02330 [Legionella sp.]|nr:MAG: hypothetical protein EPN84_02330 [Legionella sp.]
MKKLMIAFVLSAPMLLLTGCAVDTVTYSTVGYDPVYTNDYIYSVGYQPYWGGYYSGYGVGGYGYWGSYYY